VTNVLPIETFDSVLTTELKRALRSQSFLTLVVLQPQGGESAAAPPAIASLVGPELRETDMLAADETTVSMVLLDSDLQDATSAIARIMERLQHYQFSHPVEIQVGAACCPTHGSDCDTLKRVALARLAPPDSR
jgi:hypothetical protein